MGEAIGGPGAPQNRQSVMKATPLKLNPPFSEILMVRVLVAPSTDQRTKIWGGEVGA